MNAPARITIPDDAALDSIEDAYRHSISIHCPNDPAIDVRVRIAKIRDAATMGMPRVSHSAAALLSVVMHDAMHAVYAPLPASCLIRILSALSLTMEAARALERVQRNG